MDTLSYAQMMYRSLWTLIIPLLVNPHPNAMKIPSLADCNTNTITDMFENAIFYYSLKGIL